MPYDTRTRRSKATSLGVWRTSWNNPSKYWIGVGSLYENDETVYSWRGNRGKKLTFVTRPKSQTAMRIRITEPHNFTLSRVRYTLGKGRYLWSTGLASWAQNSGDYLDAIFPGRADLYGWVNSFTYTTDNALFGSAVNRAYASLNAPQIAGLTQVVEMFESLEMLRDIAVGAIKLFKLYERTKTRHGLFDGLIEAGITPWFPRDPVPGKRDPTQPISMAADAWLLLRYGLMPLYLSAMDIIQGLERPTDEPFIVEEQAKRTPNDIISFYQEAVGYTTLRLQLTKHVEQTANCKLYARYKRDKNPFGFGAYDTLTTAWEKIPLSFVVDWFVGVADWIAAYRPGGASVEWSYCTYKIRAKASWSPVSAKSSLGPAGVFEGEPISVERSFVSRVTPVTPSLIPVWNEEILQWFRKVDALALIWGVAASLLKSLLLNK